MVGHGHLTSACVSTARAASWPATGGSGTRPVFLRLSPSSKTQGAATASSLKTSWADGSLRSAQRHVPYPGTPALPIRQRQTRLEHHLQSVLPYTLQRAEPARRNGLHDSPPVAVEIPSGSLPALAEPQMRCRYHSLVRLRMKPKRLSLSF